MAKFLDLMLCIFPFEPELYLASGLKAVFVGHPMLDSLASMKSAEHSRDAKVIGLFPGSRTKEIARILPVMLEVARKLHQQDASMRFEVAAASETAAVHIRKQIEAAGASDWCPAIVHDAHRLMQRAAVGLVASGTATLEAAFFEMPMVVIYKVAWLTWIVGKQLVRVPFLAMPNILAGREIVPEFLQNAAQPERIAREMGRLLHDPSARAEMQRRLAGVIAQLGDRGAADRAAGAISAALNERSPA
jgi:lipid-A-disaccharide synthase